MLEIESEWKSITEYIYHSVFECPFTIVEPNSQKSVDKKLVAGKRVFQENTFPYQISGRHFIMWYAHNQARFVTDDVIDEDITAGIERIVGPEFKDTYQYAWYENPNMTIPGVYHVQVFWSEI
jgi:hypothetical protein